jgi:CRISPR-associated protein Cas1
MAAGLDDLRWHKVSLELINTRNTFAREHPLSIFESVFKNARTLPGQELAIDLVFHHTAPPLAPRIQKKQRYFLELIFFRAELETIERYMDNLRQHLQDWRNNFSIVSLGPPQPRSLEILLAEHPSLPPSCREICLDFRTPFPFPVVKQEQQGRDWRRFITGQDFFCLLSKRIHTAFGLIQETVPEPSLDGIQVLPYYWEYRKYGHCPKSNDGDEESLQGTVGPLYIKGEIARVYPLLLLCSEIHASSKPAKGRGYFVLEQNRPYFDPFLTKLASLRKALEDLRRESDLVDELQSELIEPDSVLMECHEQICAGRYRPAPFHGFTIAKKSGGTRIIATAGGRDQMALRMLHSLLSPVMEQMFEECSIGYRKGRSRSQARNIIAQAVRRGYTHVLESDIESFFDAIDWDLLLEKLRAALPQADHLTLSLLEGFIKAELLVNHRPFSRERGLIQGMSLAPLLANLYLDSFDEEMSALGYLLVRYGDDFVVMTRSREEAERAQNDATAILDALCLRLKEKKTLITPFDAGFSFLGFDFGPELDEEFIERTALRKTVFVRNLYAFIGIDGESLFVRKDKQVLSRVPFNRIGELVIFGDNTLSSRLLHQCSKRAVPVSFCQAGGKYINTLRPDSKRHFEVAAVHSRRFLAMTEGQRHQVAHKIVSAKLVGYSNWLAGRYGAGAREICDQLQLIQRKINLTEKIDSLRGYEGEAAQQMYAFLRTVLGSDLLKTGKREPRKKNDPGNVLLDFASHLIFSRLNVLVRSLGLNPYLGFLHSHKDDYESLVCDLQEPFRARMDRFVVKIVNRRVIRDEHFEYSKLHGNYAMTREGARVFLEAFEREVNIRMAGDGGTLQQLLVAQAQALRLWAEGKVDGFICYRADNLILTIS